MYFFVFLLLFCIIILLSLFHQEGFDNMLSDLQVDIPTDNQTITVPNTIKGNKGNDLTLGGNVTINQNSIQKGNTFIKPAGSWTNTQPSIDLAIGDNDTGLKWKEDGIVSFWGDSQEIGTFGKDGMTMKGSKTLEFGKGEYKEWNAGKIGYKTWTGNSLDIVGAGVNWWDRKVHIYDDLNVGNNLTVTQNSTLNRTTLRGHTRIIGGQLLELGADTGKGWEGNGSISYKTSWDPNALNMVGAENGGPRKIHIWDDVEINGNLWVNGNLTVGSGHRWTLNTQDWRLLHFLHNDTQKDNWGDNAGHVIMAGDGNLWVSRSSYRGWMADNMKQVARNRDEITTKIRVEAERVAREAEQRIIDAANAAANAARSAGNTIRSWFR